MERVKTPFLWSGCWLICMYLFFSIAAFSFILFEKPSLLITILFSCVNVILLFSGITHILERLPQYTIGPEGLTVRVFGIKIRQIHWSEISHAIYCYIWRDPFLLPTYTKANIIPIAEPMEGQMIFVTMDAVEPFTPAKHWRWWHRLIHLGSSLCIFLPRDNVTVYTDAFRKYYPKMERQSVEKPFG